MLCNQSSMEPITIHHRPWRASLLQNPRTISFSSRPGYPHSRREFLQMHRSTAKIASTHAGYLTFWDPALRRHWSLDPAPGYHEHPAASITWFHKYCRIIDGSASPSLSNVYGDPRRPGEYESIARLALAPRAIHRLLATCFIS
jgi:hypothetical protein